MNDLQILLVLTAATALLLGYLELCDRVRG